MLIDHSFAQFGELAAKLWLLEITVVYSSSPGRCTLRVANIGSRWVKIRGLSYAHWPERAYPVFS